MKRMTTIGLALVGLTLSALPAAADAKTEAYVQTNASEVLATLNDPALTADQRTKAFSVYMDKFTDLDAVSNFVIGKYSRRFTDAELAAYRRRSATMRSPFTRTSSMTIAARKSSWRIPLTVQPPIPS